MVETVSINDLTLCHKNSSGWVKSTLPDVCKSPVDPVPYINTAYSRDLEDGTTTVLSNGDAMCGILGSRFFPSYDDEPGTGGGVISGVNQHQATWLSWSPNVFFEGRPVTRLTDKMLLNKGNTVSIGGYYTGPITADRGLLNLLCKLACDCKGKGNQTCVAAALRATQSGKTGVFPEVTFDPSGNMYTYPDGTPKTQMGVPGSRLDVVQVANGSPTALAEMKFAGDRFRGSQFRRYQALSQQRGIPLHVIDVEKDCKCTNKRKQKQPQKQPAPQTAPQTNPSSSPNWGLIGGGALVVGGVACIILEPCGAAVGTFLGLGGGAVLATQ